MTSPCAACSLEFDPQALKGKSFWEGITTGANYGAKVLEAHHALLAAQAAEIAKMRNARDFTIEALDHMTAERDAALAAVRKVCDAEMKTKFWPSEPNDPLFLAIAEASALLAEKKEGA